MLVTLLRHATAEPHSLSNEDEERALIKKGKDQVARVAEFCRKNALLPGRVYCSPLLRARQTAQLLAGALADCPPPQVVDWLGLGAEPEEIVEELAILQAASQDNIWLVGHEPDISALVAYWLDANREGILIKKASLTRIDVSFASRSTGQLLWSIPCSLMR